MEKSPDAFRTISEVADWLDVPTHVLRFWESRFTQIKPVKRAGGRRYYRPSDMRIIGGVKTLLHDRGMTIRGVQKLFREQGIRHVSAYSPDLFGDLDAGDDSAVIDAGAQAAEPAPAARTTRAAEPAPVPSLDLPEEEEDRADTETEAAPDMVFVHRAPEAEASPAEPAPARPRIPATPQVPPTDPEDDDSGHARGPGIGAALAIAGRARLERHRPLLAEAARRLRELAEGVS